MSKKVIIDLSHWNKEVDFKLVKEDGIIGIIHKASQGIKYVDPKYAERRKKAEDEGLFWGAYHFGTGEDGKEQAHHFLDVVGNREKVLLALDIEENAHGENITPKQAEDFVETIRRVTGRLPLIYGNGNFLKNFATPILTECPLWIAAWMRRPILPKGWSNWTLWQYTNGEIGPEPHYVNGVGKCDHNKFNGSPRKLEKFWMASNKFNVNVSFEGELAQYLIDIAKIENKSIEEILEMFVRERLEEEKEIAEIIKERDVEGAKTIAHEDVKWD